MLSPKFQVMAVLYLDINLSVENQWKIMYHEIIFLNGFDFIRIKDRINIVLPNFIDPHDYNV